MSFTTGRFNTPNLIRSGWDCVGNTNDTPKKVDRLFCSVFFQSRKYDDLSWHSQGSVKKRKSLCSSAFSIYACIEIWEKLTDV